MKISRIAVALALALCVVLALVVPNWPGSRESHASAVSPPTAEEETGSPHDALVAAAEPAPVREEASVPVADGASASSVARPEFYAFLHDDVQPLATLVREPLKAFDARNPAEQLDLGRDLLVHSIAVIQCATEIGPIPKGAAGDGDLSYTGRDGKWAFQINSWTFHLREAQFPEYREYMALLNSAHEAQRI